MEGVNEDDGGEEEDDMVSRVVVVVAAGLIIQINKINSYHVLYPLLFFAGSQFHQSSCCPQYLSKKETKAIHQDQISSILHVPTYIYTSMF
jgi:hypothetical protein